MNHNYSYSQDTMQLFPEYLLLHGGVDINPARYNQAPLKQTQSPNNHRDAQEFGAVYTAVKDGLPIIGICRGAQLICIANGGSLWQHADGHGNSHQIKTSDGDVFNASASHHQIMNLEGTRHIVYAFDPIDTLAWNKEGAEFILSDAPEVVWFPETKSLAIQPHPEWEAKNSPFIRWLTKLTKDLTGLSVVY